MSKQDLERFYQQVQQQPSKELNQFLKPKPENLNLETVNQLLNNKDPILSISWAAETFGDGLVMSISFGIHSAVMLHLVTQICPNIPVIWTDTGYLHKETYFDGW